LLQLDNVCGLHENEFQVLKKSFNRIKSVPHSNDNGMQKSHNRGNVNIRRKVRMEKIIDENIQF